jgi:plasmid stabilization system protein ParE
VLPVRFHQDAEAEFHEAVLWYENQRIGLGPEFVLCIDEAVERIRRGPQGFPVILNEVRRAVVRRFPFAIFFEARPEEIRVLAVFHSRRDPSRWQSRA